MILIEGSANLAILVLKTAVGLATGSIGILGDAVHSLTDLANNAIAWVVIRMSARPADSGHPYGHRKFESVAVFGLAMLLTVFAFELAASALRRDDRVVVQSSWALALMLCVLAINALLASWQGWQARRLSSELLGADARHTFADVLTTLAVIGGWQAASRGHPWVDSVAAVGVAGVILVLAYGLFRRAVPILVDASALEPEALAAAARSVPGIADVRRVRSRGHSEHAAVDVVVVVAPTLSTLESHELATAVEQAIQGRFPVDSVIVHVEPAGRGDPDPS